MITASPDRAVPDRAVEAPQGSPTNDTIAVSRDKRRSRSIAARVKPVRNDCVGAIRSQKSEPCECRDVQTKDRRGLSTPSRRSAHWRTSCRNSKSE
jgi:hypothetical protein